MALNLIGGIVGKILPEAGKIIDDLHTSTEEKMAARQKMEQLLVSAEQQAQQMEFVLQRETKEAERKRIEAEGIRDAQNIIKEGITKDNIEWRSLEVLKELSSSPNAKIIITDGKTPVLINND